MVIDTDCSGRCKSN